MRWRRRDPSKPVWIFVVLLVAVCLAGSATAERRRYALDDDPVRLGNKALADSRLVAARTHFEEAVANDHHLPEAFFGLARVDEREGRFADAEARCLQALAAAGGAYPRARAVHGLLLLRSGRTDAAAAELARALQEDPKLWEAHYGQARLQLAAGDLAAARQHLDRGRDRRGLTAGEDLFRHGEALLLQAAGDLEGAERAALQAMNLNPANPEYGELVARIYAARGYDTLAINTYEQVLATPGITATAPLLHALGRLYAGQHRYNDASSRYLQAVAADSTYAPAVFDLAELFRLAKRWDKAAGTYLRYVDLVPEDVGARLALAESLFELERYDEAAAAARAVRELDPHDTTAPVLFVRAGLRSDDPTVAAEAVALMAESPADTLWQSSDLLILAERQEAAGDHAAAAISLARAAALDPDQARIPYRQGLMALHAQQPADAVEHFRRATALEPGAAVYHLNLGIALYQAEDLAAATDAFGAAVASDGDLVAARLLLAQALAATGELDEAEGEYQQVLAREPENTKAMRGIGFCRLRRADYAGAAAIYADAAAADPQNADSWAGLGGAHLGLGDLTSAAEAFDRARAIDPDNPMLKAGSRLLNQARNAGKDDQPK